MATPYNFLARFLKAAGCQQMKDVRLYASYLTELSLPDYGMLKYSYSQIAAAAVYTAQRYAPAASRLPCGALHVPIVPHTACDWSVEAVRATCSLLCQQCSWYSKSVQRIHREASHCARVVAKPLFKSF